MCVNRHYGFYDCLVVILLFLGRIKSAAAHGEFTEPASGYESLNRVEVQIQNFFNLLDCPDWKRRKCLQIIFIFLL